MTSHRVATLDLTFEITPTLALRLPRPVCRSPVAYVGNLLAWRLCNKEVTKRLGVELITNDREIKNMVRISSLMAKRRQAAFRDVYQHRLCETQAADINTCFTEYWK